MSQFRRYFNDPANPTTVSRDVPPGEYSWDSVVFQSGKPVLDAELQLVAESAEYANLLIANDTLPSGFLRPQGSAAASNDFNFPTAVPGNENTFFMSKRTAFVAGMPVVVEYTGTTTPGTNVIALPVPTASSGLPPDVKRTDFVFLEVWRTLVAPSPRAMGTIQIHDPQTISPGDTVTINAIPVGGPSVTFTANGGGPTGFVIGGSGSVTATNLAAAINNPVNGLFPAYVAANTLGSDIMTIAATFGGTTGNLIGLARVEAVAGSILLSAATLLGGANRPNKPSQGTVYRHGNVSSPLGVALPDDLVDPVFNAETAQRIQIQYRIRVYSNTMPGGVNPKVQPDGFSNPGVLAQGTQGAPVATYPFVPANNSTVIANSSAPAYGFLDGGLYVAGNGTQASAFALGTVDGFVYAIPIGFVFRRNDATGTAGFSPVANANGGLPVAHAPGFPNGNLNPGGPYPIAAGKSDRPDGLFADIIVPSDLLDLRRSVTPPGYDFGTELKYQLQSLLDKKTATWQVDGSDYTTIGNGSGDQSAYPLMCDEVGRLAAQGGAPPASGTTTRGNPIRNYDHIARRFGSQSVVERLIFEVRPVGPYPTGISVVKAPPSVNSWCAGDQITFQFSGVGALNPTTLQTWLTPAVAGVDVNSFWPIGTKVTDVISVFHDDGHNAVPVDQTTQLATVVGIGTGLITITLDPNPSVVNDGGTAANHPLVDNPAVDNGSVRRLFIEFEVTYPTGAGTTETPDVVVVPSTASGYPGYNGGPIVENAPAQRPPEMLAAWIPNPKFRQGFREVKLEQKTAPLGAPIVDMLVTRTGSTVYPPRRFYADSMLVNGLAPAAGTTYGSSERKANLAVAVANQTLIPVTYYSQDPVPNAGGAGYQTAIYYRTNAPQTAGTQLGGIPSGLLPTQILLEPVAVSAELWTGQAGKGSTELSFPYDSPLDQIAIATGRPPASTPKEWYFSALAEVAVSDFSASAGLISLHSFVQVDGTNPIQLGDVIAGRGPVQDPEFRAYYDVANPGGYKPSAFSQPLYGPTRHKVFQPMLVRTTVDTLLFRRGEVLLLILSRFADLDADNKIAFSDLPAIRTAAALYRSRNLLLTVGD
jgi:hypothetical protein